MAKKLLKLIASSLVSLGIAFTPLAFGGCNTTDHENDPGQNIVTPTPDPNPGVDPNPGDNTEIENPDDPNKQPEENPEPEEDNSKYETTNIPRTDLNNFYRFIRDGKNYTLDLVSGSGNNYGGTLERDGDKIYFINESVGENYFVTNDGENDLKINYDTTNNNEWVATIADSSDENALTIENADKKVPSFISSINYKRYNTKTGEYKGRWEDSNGVFQDVSVYISKEDSVITSFEINVLSKTDPFKVTFSELGSTSVAIPDYVLGSEIDNSKTVLTVENGKYNFDYKLTRPIVENFLKGNNARNTDLVNETISNKTCETEQVLFMNLSKTDLELYVVYQEKDSNQRRVGQFKITGSALLDDLANVNSLTENELTNYLKTANCGLQSVSNAKNYSIDYISTDADFASHKEQFNALTSKVIERAQTVGTQGNSIDNPGNPVDYSGYNIVTAFKTLPDGPSTTVYKCEGENYNFDLVYLVENNGNYQLLDYLVVSSTERGYDKLLTNITGQDATTAKNWMVVSAKPTDMSAENGNLYDYSTNKSVEVNYNYRDAVIDDKDYTL